MKKLENKVAVVYSDGTIGGAVAKAFARAGANVYLAGRTRSRLDIIADESKHAGFSISVAQVDALDEHAVQKHLSDVIGKESKIDISFNAIGIPQKGIQGISLADLSVESFLLPVTTYTKSHFITSKTALKYMLKQGNGVILMHTPNASRISPTFVGGMIPAWAALEALNRSLSAECGPNGIRTVSLLTTGIPETSLIDDVWNIHGKANGITYEQFNTGMQAMTHRRKLTTLKELEDAAVFVSSDEGSAITGTIFNLTAGMIVD